MKDETAKKEVVQMTPEGRKAYNEYMKEYKKKNKDKIAEYNRQYRKEHPERMQSARNAYWNRIAENKTAAQRNVNYERQQKR